MTKNHCDGECASAAAWLAKKSAERDKKRRQRAKRKATMSPEEFELARKKRCEYENKLRAKKRAAMSPEELEAAKNRHRESEKKSVAKKMAAMSPEELEAAKEINRARMSAERENQHSQEVESRANFSNTSSQSVFAMDPDPQNKEVRHFKRHQDDPEANTILNHITTYRNHFVEDPSDPIQHEVLKKKIQDQYITPEHQRQAAERFLHAQGRGCRWSSDQAAREFVGGGVSRDAPLYACACCGYRAINTPGSNQTTFIEVGLEDLEILKLSQEDEEIHMQKINGEDSGYTQTLPTNNDGDRAEFQIWKAYSIWPQRLIGPADGDVRCYYHLHPELVERKNITLECPESSRLIHNAAQAYKVKVCTSCKASIDKDIVPPNSVKYKDFGSYHRVGLTPLSLMERHIISKCRHYSQVVKIESNTGRQRDHSQCCIKGSCIVFDHDSPKVCANLLTQDSIKQDILIHFLGPEGQHDTLLQKTRSIKTSHLFARAYVVYQWMSVLKKVNPLYKDEPEIPQFNQFSEMLGGTIDKMISEAENTIEDEAVQIARDDVAGIRGTSNPESMNNVPSENEAQNEQSGQLSLRYLYVTNKEKTANGSQNDTTHDFLCNAAKTVGLKTDLEKQKYMESNSRRGEDPLNEFTEGHLALAGGWPDVFFLGKNVWRRETLTEGEIMHLLMQFTNAASSCQLLLFYLFDMKQRHSTIQGMHAKIRKDPKAFESFTKTFMSRNFQSKLLKAVAIPDGADAKFVLKRLVPMLTTGGKNTVFGALERRAAAGQILAMGRKYGGAR